MIEDGIPAQVGYLQVTHNGVIQNDPKQLPSVSVTKKNPIVARFLEGYPLRDPECLEAYDVSSFSFANEKTALKDMKRHLRKHAFHTSIEVNSISYAPMKTIMQMMAFPELKEIVLWGNDSSWC